jgi:hypothetical protein
MGRVSSNSGASNPFVMSCLSHAARKMRSSRLDALGLRLACARNAKSTGRFSAEGRVDRAGRCGYAYGTNFGCLWSYPVNHEQGAVQRPAFYIANDCSMRDCPLS